ncbi:MAG: polysaccharide deacetylase family protein [Hyphomicrobiaceae bacterium]
MGNWLNGWTRLAVVCVAGLGVVTVGPREALNSASTCGPGTLGVSRTVEIDTKGGPRYGLMQYKDHDFLADGEVVLTFDDGPLRRHTQAILNALESHCTKATFFMVGTMALSDAPMVREVALRGHTVGSHTWSHRYQLGRITPQRATQEIELGISAIQLALGEPLAPFFRFPFLSDQKAAMGHLSERNISAFSIDVDSLDYRAKGAGGADAVYRRVMNDLATLKKGILLFHDIQPTTAAALPRILEGLKAKGFKVVHIVGKTKGTTLAEYDGMAEKEASRRRSVVAAAPLAPRAVTWPLASPATTQGWAPTSVAPANDTAPAAPEPDWRRSVFGN